MTEIESRKKAHIDICLHEDVEHGSTYFDNIFLIHKSLPELAREDINIEAEFLGKKINAPIFISCMTGGSKDGATINKRLAELAARKNIPLGLGSMRILFEQEDVISDFMLRDIAGQVPIFANIGAVQLAHITSDRVFSMLEKLQVDGIAIHLNPAQELCQKNGERDFRNLISHINVFIAKCPVPVIIKETGYGILPAEAKLLLGYGAKYVDVAGSGGSNWAKIECLREKKTAGFEDTQSSAMDMLGQAVYDLGVPTALLMLALYKQDNILASGGIRSALDVVRCLVLGAKGVGLALPILKQVMRGTEYAVEYFDLLTAQITQVLLLCGAKNLQEARDIPFYMDESLQHRFVAFCRASKIEVHPTLRELLSIMPR